MSNQVHCPKCGSTQLTANKKGFSGRKAAAGAVLTGGIGILAGTLGSNKIVITCLACGHEFRPGEQNKVKGTKANKSFGKVLLGMIGMCFLLGSLIMLVQGKAAVSVTLFLLGITCFWGTTKIKSR